jgi:hypothetical protein
MALGRTKRRDHDLGISGIGRYLGLHILSTGTGDRSTSVTNSPTPSESCPVINLPSLPLNNTFPLILTSLHKFPATLLQTHLQRKRHAIRQPHRILLAT